MSDLIHSTAPARAGAPPHPGLIVMHGLGDDEQGPLAEILLRRSRLRGLKRLPRIPSALPILFLRPTLRLQEIKIGR